VSHRTSRRLRRVGDRFGEPISGDAEALDRFFHDASTIASLETKWL